MNEESTPTGDALNLSQVATAIKGLLGASEPPKTDEAKSPETQVESTEIPKPDAEEVDESGEETQAEGTEDTSEESVTDEQTGAVETFYETLDELAEAAGVPLEQLLSLKTRTKVDGIEEAVPLAQIVKSYQLEGHLTRKQQEVAEKLKAMEAEKEKLTSDLNNRLQEAGQLIGHFEQQFMADFNAVDWNDLRQTNPAEFAARKQDYNDRYSQLMAYRQQIQANAEKLHNEAAEKAKTKFQEILQTEEQQLLSKFPEWKEPEKAKSGKKEVSDYLRGYGFNDNEIAQIYDHRQVEIIHKAMLYDKQSTKTEVAKKKVATLPKVLKPSAQKSDPKEAAMKAAMAKLDKSGRVEDAAALIKLRLRK